MATEVAYLGHDNSIDLILKTDGVAQDLTAVTKITITIGPDTVTSTDKAAGAIRWDQAGYATGEIRLFLGDQDINPGSYSEAWVVVYDPTNTDGVVWGSIELNVEDEVERA